MARAPVRKTGAEEVNIVALDSGDIRLRIIGTQPLFQNRMAEKIQQGLLVGMAKKTKAERVHIKHHPLEEYRSSAETMRDGPTALGVRVMAIKGAMAKAALSTPGLTKTEVERLIFMPGEMTPLYGIPQLRMDVVRSADINRTPDIRTRCFIPKWGAEVFIKFVVPQFSANSIITLLCNAGVINGIGDFRQEKGKGGFGVWRVIADGERDPEWDDLVKNHGRMKQLKALKDPEYANEETAALMEFYQSEVKRRAA